LLRPALAPVQARCTHNGTDIILRSRRRHRVSKRMVRSHAYTYPKHRPLDVVFITSEVEVLVDELNVDVAFVIGGQDGLSGLGFDLLVTTSEFGAHALVVGLEAEQLFYARCQRNRCYRYVKDLLRSWVSSRESPSCSTSRPSSAASLRRSLRAFAVAFLLARSRSMDSALCRPSRLQADSIRARWGVLRGMLKKTTSK
jgi:hypothetical protein